MGGGEVTHDLNCLFAISLFLFGLRDKGTINRMDRKERLLKTEANAAFFQVSFRVFTYAMANKDWNSCTLASDAVTLRRSPKVDVALIGRLDQ